MAKECHCALKRKFLIHTLVERYHEPGHPLAKVVGLPDGAVRYPSRAEGVRLVASLLRLASRPRRDGNIGLEYGVSPDDHILIHVSEWHGSNRPLGYAKTAPR